LATAHGAFLETDGHEIHYRVNPGAESLAITMMSRKGLLPEADFYHPVPYEPLSICTPEAVERLIDDQCDALLDQSYALFKAEPQAADPDYSQRIGLQNLPLEDFADRYFADRADVDPFVWAEANLAEARDNYARRFTVPWRYAILRMHEVLAMIVPHLSTDALDRFNRCLKPVFTDDYATVPHLSIERLLALRRAGHLDVAALGDDHRIDTRGEAPGATVTAGGARWHYPAFIDATGQRPLAIDDLPFPTLIEQGVVQSEGKEGPKGIVVDDCFHPASGNPAAARLFCLNIPFILGRHPFIQGITSSCEMGRIVGTELAKRVSDRNDGQR